MRYDLFIGSKDDEDLTETKEMSKCPGYDLLSGRERKVPY
jgi:hypothetical protein